MADAQAPQGTFASIKIRFETYFSLFDRWLPAAQAYVAIFFQNICAGNLKALLNPSSIGDESFAEWWLAVSHNFINYENTTAVPALVASAYGTVLDLGAGSGNQLQRFDASKLKKVYGIEANAALIPALTEKVKKLGMENIYTPIVSRVEDMEAELRREGVMPGTVDCIVCIQLLCSVGDPEGVVKKIHSLLKPGGELIFWEHQRNEVDWMTRMAQGFWTILWRPVIGQCRLNQATRKAIFAAADWDVAELEVEESSLDLMPRIWGKLKKK